VRNHVLLEELAIQRQEMLSARARAHRPTETGVAEPRPPTTRRPGSLARMVGVVSRA
jgi:hypothetical protein